MLRFFEQGYRKQQLYILNQIRMSLHAISLSDITTSIRLAVSQNAFLLLSSNSLREDYEWPLTPPSFSNKQKQLWQTALQAIFVVSHLNKNERKLRPSARLGLWTDTKVEQKWTTFFSQEEYRIYKRVGLRWLVYTSAGGCNARSQLYSKLNTSTLSLCPSANQLASICPRHLRYAIELCTPWEVSELDDNPLLFDPTAGPFTLVWDAFAASVGSRRPLLIILFYPKITANLSLQPFPMVRQLRYATVPMTQRITSERQHLSWSPTKRISTL